MVAFDETLEEWGISFADYFSISSSLIIYDIASYIWFQNRKLAHCND